jgi:hypothetical protein
MNTDRLTAETQSRRGDFYNTDSLTAKAPGTLRPQEENECDTNYTDFHRFISRRFFVPFVPLCGHLFFVSFVFFVVSALFKKLASIRVD